MIHHEGPVHYRIPSNEELQTLIEHHARRITEAVNVSECVSGLLAVRCNEENNPPSMTRGQSVNIDLYLRLTDARVAHDSFQIPLMLTNPYMSQANALKELTTRIEGYAQPIIEAWYKEKRNGNAG